MQDQAWVVVQPRPRTSMSFHSRKYLPVSDSLFVVFSILHTPTLMSNYQKKRGFLDPTRILNPHTFDPNRADQAKQGEASSTGMLNNQLGGAGNEMSSHTQVIWGTNINTSDVSMKLKNFINNFEEIREDEDEVADDRLISSYYMQKIKEIRELDISVLEIDCDHIF